MIQRATKEHINMLARAGIGLVDDLPTYASAERNIEHTTNMLNIYIGLPQLGIFFKEVDGEIVGIFMGIVAAPWFSPILEMSEIIYWVRADYRKSDLGKRLIKTMEEWAISMGAKRLILAVASGYRTETVAKYYNMLGYQNNGIQCCKEVG